MSGIDRLRTLAGEWDAYGLGGPLEDIAGQIERERACDADTTENVRLIVGGVIDEMEHHIIGHEGMEDSPVARWACELREAMKSDTSDERDAQNPSCAGDAETADVTSEAPKVTRDPAEDVSMSAYDLLPQEEREAIAWVREHGGVGGIECAVASLNDRIYRRQRQIDESHAALRRRNERIAELERERDELREMIRQLNAQTDEMEKRLMPEGMEWLVEAWPRFEDDAPIRFGDEFIDHQGDVRSVLHVKMWQEGGFELGTGQGTYDWHECGERVKRPAPKVLDADGAEIELGDDLYSVEGSLKFHVSHVDRTNGKIATDAMLALDKWADPAMYTHRAPVLAADGRPLREGETVWDTKGNGPYIIEGIEDDGVVRIKGNDLDYFGADFTHERPDSWERLEEDAGKFACEYFGRGGEKDTCTGCRSREIDPCTAKDCEFNKTIDLVRRAKALVGDA